MFYRDPCKPWWLAASLVSSYCEKLYTQNSGEFSRIFVYFQVLVWLVGTAGNCRLRCATLPLRHQPTVTRDFRDVIPPVCANQSLGLHRFYALANYDNFYKCMLA